MNVFTRQNSNLAVIEIPGCGSNSLHHGARSSNLAAFIRDPMERCVSKYQSNGEGLTWREWVDRILDGVDNAHWRPQVRFLAPDTILIPFERIGEFVDVHLNRSVPVTLELSYRRAELEEYYAEDYALRERILP